MVKQVLDRADQLARVGLDQPAIHAVVDTFGEAAASRCDHRQRELLQFGQGVAEGFRHHRQQCRNMRSQVGQQVRQRLTLVLQYHRHARQAEEIFTVLTRSQQVDVGVSRQLRQAVQQQLLPLAWLYSSGYQEPQLFVLAPPRRNRPCLFQGWGAMWDQADVDISQRGLQLPAQLNDRRAGRGQVYAWLRDRRDVIGAYRTPCIDVVIDELHVVGLVGERGCQVDVAVVGVVGRVHAQQRPQRKIIVHHLDGGKTSP